MSDNSGMDVQTLIDKAGSVPELAALAGVARTTVLDWKRTGYVPGNRVAQISKALDLPAEDVLKLVQPPRVASTAEVAVA